MTEVIDKFIPKNVDPFFLFIGAGLLGIAYNVTGGSDPFDWLDAPRQSLAKTKGLEDVANRSYQIGVQQFVSNVEEGKFNIDPRSKKKMMNLNGSMSLNRRVRDASMENINKQNYRWGSGNLGGAIGTPYYNTTF
jgi:hypothetical protein